MNDMVDMAQFVEAKSDQLNADDLIGAPRTITVRKVTGNDGDQPVSIFYDGDNNKPFKPCKTMRRVLLAVWGRNAQDYVGRSMTLYRDDKVQFGGLEVGGIRIRAMSHIEKEALVVVMKTKGKKAGIKIEPLVVEQQQRQAQGQTAEQWAEAHLAAVEQAADQPTLARLIAKGEKALAKLRTAMPDKAEAIERAYEARAGALAQERKPDDEFGEAMAEDEY